MTLVEIEFVTDTATRAKGDVVKVDPASADSLCAKGCARKTADKRRPKPKPVTTEPETEPETVDGTDTV